MTAHLLYDVADTRYSRTTSRPLSPVIFFFYFYINPVVCFVYRSAVASLCYACCSTLSSASARTSHVPQCRRLTALCCIIRLMLNSFFSLSPNLTCTSVPSPDFVMLYYTLDAQLFLQPQPVPHICLSAVI